jgi:hypothetical protein
VISWAFRGEVVAPAGVALRWLHAMGEARKAASPWCAREQAMNKLDLNTEWGEAEIAAMLASVKDDRDWRLEVDLAGVLSLHDMSQPTGLDYDKGMHCFFEMWSQGTDYVGPGAASDKKLVAKITAKLKANYPALQGSQTLYA